MGIIWITVVSVNEKNVRDYDWHYRDYGINSLDQVGNYATKIQNTTRQGIIGIKIDFVNEIKVLGIVGNKVVFVNDIKVFRIIGIKVVFVNEIKL